MEPMHNEFEWSGVSFARRRPPLRLARFMLPAVGLLLLVGVMTDTSTLTLSGVALMLLTWFVVSMWRRRVQ